MSNGIEKQFSTGAIQATIWNNNKDGQTGMFTVSLNRRYKDKYGNWKTTNNFGPNDLPKAKLLIEKAYEFLTLKADEIEMRQIPL
ncbi:hypothetical protein KY335_02770 [Candidatus Woesearchaeota archaeon]|nr:hypothetical protein [Candidatus Woesearchaeota archaeon]MBW3014142.1 hypothetical protein [Candidatus Woesearchaeota archaeon]